MNYDLLIRRSWRMTWGARWLWVLGLFVPAGAGGGGGGGGGGGTPDPQSVSSAAGQVDQVTEWIVQNGQALIVAAVTAIALLLVVGLALLIVSFFAQGGMVWATAALARDEPATLGAAWQAGRRFAWRYVGLWLVQIGLVLIGLAAVGLPLLALAFASDTGRITALVLGLSLILPILLLSIAFSIMVNYALRAIAVEDVGPWTALTLGWRLLYANLGASTLTWLLQVGLAIAASIVVLIVLAVIGIPLGLIGFGWFAAAGLGVGLIAYIVLAVIVIIAVMWVVSAILNTFFWSYWTLAYLSLTGRLTPALPAA